jgi:hypothetical protein
MLFGHVMPGNTRRRARSRSGGDQPLHDLVQRLSFADICSSKCRIMTRQCFMSPVDQAGKLALVVVQYALDALLFAMNFLALLD